MFNVIIEAIPVSGDIPLMVSFSATLSGDYSTPLSYWWDFGDGTTKNPGQGSTSAETHVYSAAGVYDMDCYVVDNEYEDGDGYKTISALDSGIDITISASTVVMNFSRITAEVVTTYRHDMITSGDPIRYLLSGGDDIFNRNEDINTDVVKVKFDSSGQKPSNDPWGGW